MCLTNKDNYYQRKDNKMAQYHSIDDELISGMMEVYRKTIKDTGSEKAGLNKAKEWLRNNNCKCSDRTIRRQINKNLGGAYQINSVNTFKIDPSRENDIEIMHSKIESILNVLLDRFHEGAKEKVSNSSLITLADAISRQRELQIKLLSLSPKKTQTNTTTVDLGDGGGKIVIANQVESND